MASWDRIESMARSIGLDEGLEARIADPLWMLARQRQVAEFQGDDAAQPIAVKVSGRTLPLASFVGLDRVRRPLPTQQPLEAAVEAAAAPDFGSAGLHASARAARRLVHQLTAAGLDRAVDALRAAYPLRVPVPRVTLGAPGEAAAALLARRAFDSRAVAAATTDQLAGALRARLDATAVTKVQGLIAAWRAWYLRRDGTAGAQAWDDERLEHRFSVAAAGDGPSAPAPVELTAPEHDGGHLDWYTFDVTAIDVGASAKAARWARTSLPSPVRYSGMPASRWWELADDETNFGDIDAGPADLARLIVAEFATVYGDDWFVVPVKVPVGTLTEIAKLEVIDTFGGRHVIRSTALADETRTAGARVWRFLELTGDKVDSGHPSPWLLVAPTLAADQDGPAVERVLLARDEGANLAWAIERAVEGPLGRAVDRPEAWHAANPEPAVSDASEEVAAPGAPRAYSSQWWRYLLETSSPPWWIPLAPERVKAGGDPSSEVRLRRARMAVWNQLAEGPAPWQVGPQGVFLDPRRARRFLEEEVQRDGVRLERRWQIGRWHDGSLHVWLQRRKLAGRGERSSGLRWDMLVPGDGPSPAPPVPAGGKPGTGGGLPGGGKPGSGGGKPGTGGGLPGGGKPGSGGGKPGTGGGCRAAASRGPAAGSPGRAAGRVAGSPGRAAGRVAGSPGRAASRVAGSPPVAARGAEASRGPAADLSEKPGTRTVLGDWRETSLLRRCSTCEGWPWPGAGSPAGRPGGPATRGGPQPARRPGASRASLLRALLDHVVPHTTACRIVAPATRTRGRRERLLSSLGSVSRTVDRIVEPARSGFRPGDDRPTGRGTTRLDIRSVKTHFREDCGGRRLARRAWARAGRAPTRVRRTAAGQAPRRVRHGWARAGRRARGWAAPAGARPGRAGAGGGEAGAGTQGRGGKPRRSLP